MPVNEKSINRRRLQSSYITSTISIALVLFMLGLLGLLLLNAQMLSDYVKENISFSIVMKNETREADILKLQKQLDASKYIKSTEYITREKAAKDFIKSMGEDFISFLGYNPLLPIIEVKLHAAYANTEGFTIIEKQLNNNHLIKEVIYEKNLVHLVNENVKKISMIILVFSGLLFFIAIALINNTIRLQVYSKRFLIRTMQLVGATRYFIRKPFLFHSLIHGFIASLISIALIGGIILLAQKEMKEIIDFIDMDILLVLMATIIFLGIIINFISTYFALNKYLYIKTDDLY